MASPMMRSASPRLLASALSKKLTPASRAVCNNSMASSFWTWVPNVTHEPRERTLTLTPAWPRRRYSMRGDPGPRPAGYRRGVSDDVQVGRLLIPAAELTWRYDTPGGPGGQHANRAATRVELRWDVQGSTSLDEADRGRLLAALGPAVVVTAADSRSQARNRDLAVERLRSVVGEALRP